MIISKAYNIQVIKI